MAESLPCCGHVRRRLLGTLCNSPTSYTFAKRFPICSEYRQGGWNQSGTVTAPYPFDFMTITPVLGLAESYVSTAKTAYCFHQLEASGSDTWTTCPIAKVVYSGFLAAPATPIIWGVAEYTMTIQFTGTEPGGLVITRDTTSHPDPEFPPVVTWTNHQALSVNSACQLSSADGTSTIISRHLGSWNSQRGELPCAWSWAGGPKNGLECSDLEYTIDGDAAAEWSGVIHCAMTRSGTNPYQTTNPYSDDSSLHNTPVYSGGYYDRPLLRLVWNANCYGVTVTVVSSSWYAPPPSYNSYGPISWTATGLPFDWWTGPVTLHRTGSDAYVPYTLTLTPCELASYPGDSDDIEDQSHTLAHALDEVFTKYHTKWPSFSIGDSTPIQILQWFNAAYEKLTVYGAGTPGLDWFNDKWGL